MATASRRRPGSWPVESDAWRCGSDARQRRFAAAAMWEGCERPVDGES